MRILYSSKFLGSFTKLSRGLQEAFRVQEIICKENPFDPRLRTHQLKGRDEWSFLITYDIRVIFVWKKDTVLLVNIGDHSVYRRQ